ncbi:hypothetical protein LEM8419_03258 [Neolewinella maritima]|uniref:Transposase IS200-like domain-containing protein n=1 Tax=Neolewinella maritima TaxID=1383882 RepID=A0ABM9B4S3_9BACT|nr:transposase [Neolewinella maritima]CAH1002351.1 hypothetical protein LEM8419_03258 [Neolewinella maritima]
MRTEFIPSTPTHLTYRLYGSIPNLPLSQLHTKLKLRKAELNKKFNRSTRAVNRGARVQHKELLTETEREYYIAFDRLLDHPTKGPRYLAGNRAKRVIIDSWRFIAEQRNLTIYAISVMSNHVHVILKSDVRTARIPLSEVLRDHKKFTATRLNRLHASPGRRVWAEKEYCRTVRHGKFERVFWYVLNNPVKAGLTDDAVNWYGNYWAPELQRGFIDLRVA